jgi:hypothetical protein
MNKNFKILNFSEYFKLNEAQNIYKIGDIVLIEYWYNDMITPVKITNVNRGKYEITHNITESKIFNAPNEIISTKDIIDFYKSK